MTEWSRLDRPPLNARALRTALVRPGALWTDVRVVPETPSTNTDVAALARSGVAQGLVMVTEWQSAGKGRRDREWVSPPRAGLTFSVLLRPSDVDVARWSWLSVLAGVALARSVTKLGEIRAELKWPNDLLLGPDGHKAAGILAEVVDGGVVVGIGLNVTNAREELPRPDSTSLLLAGSACTDRDPLLRMVLRELAADYAMWCAHGGDPDASGLRAAYVSMCATLGQRVRVLLPQDRELLGEAVDVDSDGRLVVAAEDGLTRVAAGDVVHVRGAQS